MNENPFKFKSSLNPTTQKLPHYPSYSEACEPNHQFYALRAKMLTLETLWNLTITTCLSLTQRLGVWMEKNEILTGSNEYEICQSLKYSSLLPSKPYRSTQASRNQYISFLTGKLVRDIPCENKSRIIYSHDCRCQSSSSEISRRHHFEVWNGNAIAPKLEIPSKFESSLYFSTVKARWVFSKQH